MNWEELGTTEEKIDKIVAETTEKELKTLRWVWRGNKIVLLNLTMQGAGYEVFAKFRKPGDATRTNIVTRIGRRVSRKIGIDPEEKKNREIYDRIKLDLRAKISTYIRTNPSVNTMFENIVGKWRYSLSERTGKSKALGKKLGQWSIKQRKKRNL